ncbi:LemA family protein [Slackia heliotrinireducens]|jgi:LemA protein|uniref:LemA family protein n=1 Tax=Slackia heliotrinireducens TaxID=84110 RepID=UPI000F6E46B9|nr:LemA family protein [Slackia heliotrinireducens]VEH03469.1 LemA family [Slackia heliotrinireducens]
MSVFLVILVVLIVCVVALIALYNNLVKMRNMVDNAWAQIDVQLQRRLDLIPNVVETVKGYAMHESSTLQNVTVARAAVAAAGTPEAKMQANEQLTAALRQLFAVAEGYPDLKANTNFLSLQQELSNTEDKISYMRQSYNDTVMKYNTSIETFPAMLFAGLMGFHKRESFAADASAAVAPQIQF